MQQYYTFDQLVEQLPEICKEQRRFLQLTQADVVERLEKETGVRKDQSKISIFVMIKSNLLTRKNLRLVC